MKDINEYLNEQLVVESTQWKTNTEGSSYGRGADICNCEFKGSKKFGFMCYDEDTETGSLIAADSAEDIAEVLAMDVEYFESLFKLKVGEADSMEGHHTMRVW